MTFMTFQEARKTMGKVLYSDDGLRQSYIANIAMKIYDNMDDETKDVFNNWSKYKCDKTAEQIVYAIWGDCNYWFTPDSVSLKSEEEEKEKIQHLARTLDISPFRKKKMDLI